MIYNKSITIITMNNNIFLFEIVCRNIFTGNGGNFSSFCCPFIVVYLYRRSYLTIAVCPVDEDEEQT